MKKLTTLILVVLGLVCFGQYIDRDSTESLFETGDTPTGEDFSNMIKTWYHRGETEVDDHISDTANSLRAERSAEINDTANILRAEWRSEISDSINEGHDTISTQNIIFNSIASGLNLSEPEAGNLLIEDPGVSSIQLGTTTVFPDLKWPKITFLDDDPPIAGSIGINADTYITLNRNPDSILIFEDVVMSENLSVEKELTLQGRVYDSTILDPRNEITGVTLSNKYIYVTQNTDTTIDISAGSGVIFDTTSGAQPALKYISWSDTTDVKIPDLTKSITSVYIDINGDYTLISDDIGYTSKTRRSLIQLNTVIHSSGVIDKITDDYLPASDNLQGIRDYIIDQGPRNKHNCYNANGANLHVDKDEGSTTFLYINIKDKTSPTTRTDPAQDTVLLFPIMRDGLSGFTPLAPTFEVDTAYYDDGSGTLALIPSDRWVVIRFYWNAESELTGYGYPQETFTTKEIALNSVTKTIDLFPLFAVSSYTTALVMKKGADDLSNTALAEFTEPIATGGSGLTGIDSTTTFFDLAQADTVLSMLAYNKDQNRVDEIDVQPSPDFDLTVKSLDVLNNSQLRGSVKVNELTEVSNGHSDVVWNSSDSILYLSKPAYGGVYIDSTVVQTSFPAQFTWVKIDSVFTDTSKNINFNNDTLYITVNGRYFIEWCTGGSSAGSNKDYQVSPIINGSPQRRSTNQRTWTSGSFGSMSREPKVYDLIVGDKVYLGIRCLSTPISNFIPQWGGMSINKID